MKQGKNAMAISIWVIICNFLKAEAHYAEACEEEGIAHKIKSHIPSNSKNNTGCLLKLVGALHSKLS